MTREQKRSLLLIAAAAMLLIGLHFVPVTGWLKLVLYLIPYLLVGGETLVDACKGIYNRQPFDENLLMAVATIGAMVLGDYPEAVSVMLFYQIGELFESYAVGRSRRNIGDLMDIRPDYANVETADGVARVKPEQVSVGDTIVVKPGERVPLDGTVLTGTSALNMSALTGESAPVDVTEGSTVVSGSVNLSGVLRLRVEKVYAESTVARILELVENSSLKKAHTERFITKFARVYTPSVCGAALALAILPPVEDMWSKFGSQRDPFPQLTYPTYANTMWEAVHQNGHGCDYISEKILTEGRSRNGELRYGPRAYKTILLMDVESIRPEAAEALEKFVAAGGKAICIGTEPHQSVGLQNAAANDRRVQATVARIKARYPQRFTTVAAPDSTASVLDWYRNLQRQQRITPYVGIDRPSQLFSQNYYKHGNRDIFFLVNYDARNERTLRLDFALPELQNKTAWLWDPETGTRSRIAGWNGKELTMRFGPEESKLLVFEEVRIDDPNAETIDVSAPGPCSGTPVKTLDGLWNVTMTHAVTGEKSTLSLDSLVDFNTLPMPGLRHFAGVIDYTIAVNIDDPQQMTRLDAGNTYNGVTELLINGQSAGIKWYGERIFDIGGKLLPGKNTVTVRVTTVLGNYCKSLKDNATAQQWTQRQPYLPLGLGGPVRLF